MIHFEILQIDALRKKVADYSSKRVLYNNYFMNSLEGMLCAEGKETLLLKLPCEGFNRIYFMSNDKEELINMLKEMTSNDAVNIPTKKEINKDMQSILLDSGYSLLAVYERLYKNTNEARGEFEDDYAVPSDCKQIKELMEKQLFSPISDTIATEEEINEMIANKRALVNRDENGYVNGVLLFSIEGKRCNYRAWVSTAPAGETLFLFYNAFNLMAELGIDKSTIWVRSNNVKPRKIYLSWGYQPDGLKDYTYVKK